MSFQASTTASVERAPLWESGSARQKAANISKEKRSGLKARRIAGKQDRNPSQTVPFAEHSLQLLYHI